MIFLLKHRFETFEKLRSWKVLIENQMVKKIKILRTDNGVEFYNFEFDQFCKQNGVMRHKTILYICPTKWAYICQENE